MKGKLYGIGVGPGDPELMTCKAVRLLKKCEIIVIPKSNSGINVAFEVAKGAVPEIENKKVYKVNMPMTKDKVILKEAHEKGASSIMRWLEEGDVAFLTLGDPSIYSTYWYLHQKVQEMGGDAQIIPGIPSFCAAAATLNINLAEGREMLHIIPASYELESAMKLLGTKVFMKAGSNFHNMQKVIKESNIKQTVKMVENCGMEQEKKYHSIEELPEKAGYFSLLVIKEQREK